MKKWIGNTTLCFAFACSGSVLEVGGYKSTDAGTLSNDGGGDANLGPKLLVHLRGTTAAVAHTDGLAGETPLDQRLGIRKLTLLRTSTDSSPMVVFDHGSSSVEAGLNDKDDTVVGSQAIRRLDAGTFTVARVLVSHARFRVAATMHTLGQVLPGSYKDLIVFSDGSMIDGQTYKKGHFQFAFESAGVEQGASSGESWPIPVGPAGAGLAVESTATETTYVFPIQIAVDNSIAADVHLVFELNTHENFRWADEPTPGYQANVFDVTPVTTETVRSFGANGYRVFLSEEKLP